MFQPGRLTSYQGCYPTAAPVASPKTIPYNVQVCQKCYTHQLQYLGDLDEIYNYHASAYGSIRESINVAFVNFVSANLNITGIMEIGAGSGQIADGIIATSNHIEYLVVDPSYSGDTTDRLVIRKCFEDVNGKDLVSQPNTVLMSHVYEHFYDPLEVLHRIRDMPSIKYVYISFPDLEAYVKNDNYQVLTPEHTFYVENQFLAKVFAQAGFEMKRMVKHDDHSVFFEFERADVRDSHNPINSNAAKDIQAFYERAFDRVARVNSQLEVLHTKQNPIYAWPCSIHTVFLFTLGMKAELFDAILDNSPLKMGKYLYGYSNNLLCKSYTNAVSKPCAIVMNGGCFMTEKNVLIPGAACTYII